MLPFLCHKIVASIFHSCNTVNDDVIFFFSNRLINELNMLSEETIAGNSLTGFKRKLDCHLRDVGILHKLISFSLYCQ